MKIRFKKKRLYMSALLGIVWTGLGIYNIIEDENLRWMDYVYLLVGILYIGHYLFDFKNQYLRIESGTIRKNRLYGYGKKINLNEINSIKKFAGDYTLKTDTQKLKINTELIEEKSLAELNEILQNLNLPSDKTPFANIG
jgi:hypothetical protein